MTRVNIRAVVVGALMMLVLDILTGIASNVSEGRSLATGLYYMSYYAGGAAGTLIARMAYESWGWTGAVLCVALVQALTVGIAAVVWRQPAN